AFLSHASFAVAQSRRSRGCVSSSDASGGGWPRGKCKVRFFDRTSGCAIDEDRVDRRAGLRIDEKHARAFRREVPVSPREQRDENGTKVASARGEHIFVARRVFAVTAALEKASVDQRVEPSRQHVGRDAETLLELIEARQPVQGIAQNEDAPPLAHALEAAGNGADHALKALSLH